MNIFENWPHNWFGIWKHSSSEAPKIPLFSEVVDEAWAPADLSDIVNYLNECPLTLASGLPPAKCPLCGETLRDTGAQRSDGTWFWLSSLSHYVAKHQVRLPNRMVEHIRAKAYRAPLLTELSIGTQS